MKESALANTILSGVRNNTKDMEESGIAMDGRFIKELSQALYDTAKIKGLDSDLALALRRTTLENVAGRLGL